MSMGVCGLAELMKKGLQVDAYSPICKIKYKFGVLGFLSNVALLLRRHDVHRVRALDGHTASGLRFQH